MPDIFISYSSHDRLQALDLAEKLRTSGYDIWIDRHEIRGAARWGKEIVQAITASKLVCVLISSSSLLSENVMKELNLAAEKRKKLLPIMLEETELTEEFAYHLAGVHRVAIEDSNSIMRALDELNIGAGRVLTPPPQISTSKDIKLAVLPFDDLSREHDNEWFADGMLDELITTLGSLEDMKVPSRTDVMYYKKHHPRAQEIASDLNVRYLVGGSVRKAGEKVRINVSLTDAFTNQQIWTSHYDGSFDNIFDMQESVSKEIAETLKMKLTRKEKQIIAEKPTASAEAYELWLRGREYQNRITRSDYNEALMLYEEAIALDPNFASAYIELANLCAAYYREYSQDDKWLQKAEENIKKAEDIKGETAEILWIRGEIAWQKQDLDTAEETLQRALIINSLFHPTYSVLGNVYIKKGLIKKAIDAFSKSAELSSHHNHYFNLLVSLSLINDTKRLTEIGIKALPVLEKQIKRYPNDYFSRVCYAFTLYWANKQTEALNEAEALSKLDLDALSLFNLGGLYDKLNIPEKNIEMIRRAIEKGFRNIDAFRDGKFEDPVHQKEFEEIVLNLERIIEKETKVPKSKESFIIE